MATAWEIIVDGAVVETGIGRREFRAAAWFWITIARATVSVRRYRVTL
jgi:hypothetical protein